jgi:hypothetical protein
MTFEVGFFLTSAFVIKMKYFSSLDYKTRLLLDYLGRQPLPAAG